ncbi:thiaminase II [bacterium]|nr:thiaminase II [bacterium]
MGSPSLFEQLRAGSGRLWHQAQDHDFVSALGDGSLQRERFVYFLRQDYIFLAAYSRSLAIVAARATDLELMKRLAQLLESTLDAEMQLHREYCAEFGLSLAELEASEASPTCQAYCDFCISTAATRGPLELLTALVPCSVGYYETGLRLREQIEAACGAWPDGLADHPYGRWVEGYSSREFGDFARWMASALDELGGAEAQLPELQRLFNLGCRYEWLFWEMAWSRQSWPL